MDFLEPNAGRVGLSAVDATAFSLLCSASSAPGLVAGDAGIVLRRFFSARAPAPTFREATVARGLERAVVLVVVREVLGVVGAFLVPTGLAALVRVAVG